MYFIWSSRFLRVCLGECNWSEVGLAGPWLLKHDGLPYLHFSLTMRSDFLLILGTKLNLLSSYYSLIILAISFFSFSILPYSISSSSFFTGLLYLSVG